MSETVHMRAYCVSLLIAVSLAGLILSCFNYLYTGGGISYSAGALLVVISTFLLVVAALLLLRRRRRRWPRVWLHVWIFIDLIGTAFAAWFLEAHWLFILMVIGLLGWLAYLLLGSRAADSGGRLAQRQRLS